jgi:hypothetical protein
MFNPAPTDRDAILDAMRQGADYNFKIVLRGFQMTVRPLTILEEQQVVANVTEYLNGLPAHAKNSLAENVSLAKEYLKIASTSDVGKQDFKIHDYQLDRMTPEEIQYLYRQYLDAKEQVNPSIETMTADELNSLLAVLKKNPGAADWGSRMIELSRSQLVRICRSLIHGD